RDGHVTGVQTCALPILFALDSTTPPELIATRIIDRSSGSPDDLNRWRALFEQLQVKVFVYGAIAGRRFVGDGEAFTRRVLMTDRSEERRVGKEGRDRGR